MAFNYIYNDLSDCTCTEEPPYNPPPLPADDTGARPPMQPWQRRFFPEPENAAVDALIADLGKKPKRAIPPKIKNAAIDITTGTGRGAGKKKRGNYNFLLPKATGEDAPPPLPMIVDPPEYAPPRAGGSWLDKLLNTGTQLLTTYVPPKTERGGGLLPKTDGGGYRDERAERGGGQIGVDFGIDSNGAGGGFKVNTVMILIVVGIVAAVFIGMNRANTGGGRR